MRPGALQLLGSVHWTFMQVPPPTGHSVTLYTAQGPPEGGVTVMAAVVGLVGLGSRDGALHMSAACRGQLISMMTGMTALARAAATLSRIDALC